jgi:hypothetical protein
MEYRPREETKPGIMELVSGILRDGTEIVAKEIMAARLEMRDELDKAKSSAVMIGTGAGALLIGGILLVLMLVYLLQEFSGLDLWICYGIVGGLISLIGFIVLSVGKQRAAVTNLVPKESIEKAKEDARWITRNVKYETR